VVTSAAAVMVAVFAIFATLGLVEFKIMGVGLGVAVLLDATIVRAVLLPAAMKLLGDWNWWLPSWLEWIPRIGGPLAIERRRPTLENSDDDRLPRPPPPTRKREPAHP
jgi:RND superfamily putative drug exporter